MKIIVELDGPVLDVEPVHWAAYSLVVVELGLARKERAAFWRLVRRGAGIGDMLAGAKPRHIQRFRERLPEVLEQDECLADAAPQAGVAEELRALVVGHHALTLVTAGRNASARQRLLDANDLSIHFSRMTRLVSDPFQRLAQLKELAVDDRRVVVAAASESLVKLANEADLVAVGISNGPCLARRLTQAGARLTFGDFAELGEEIATGARRLIDAGLPPPQVNLVDRDGPMGTMSRGPNRHKGFRRR